MIAEAAARALGRELAGARRVPGGDINSAWRLELEGGLQAFVKARPDAAPGEYATEAAGLAWLAEGGARAPAVLAVDDAFLALEWIDGGRLDAAGEEELGRELAELHRSGAPAFGAPPPGAPFAGLRLGDVELAPATGDALGGVLRRGPACAAAAHGGGPRRAARRRGRRRAACDRARGELAGPLEPPARLHGDLWQGNVLAGADGFARLIDPAAYGGSREIDFAMLRFFGTPAPRMLAAYEEAYPLAPGHEARVAFHQLLPRLVHAILFGGSYGAGVVAAARRAAP